MYDFQSKWLTKENRENLVVLAPACCRAELSSHEVVHNSAPEKVSPRTEKNPEEQTLLQWQLGICCEPCTAEQESWAFCTRTCCPHVWFLSLIIFTASDFHLCWVLSWVSTAICVKCGWMFVFVASVPHLCGLLCSVKGMCVSMQDLASGMLHYLLLNKKRRRKPGCSHQQLTGLPGLPDCQSHSCRFTKGGCIFH